MSIVSRVRWPGSTGVTRSPLPIYGQARYGITVADKSTGDLWMQNPNGVLINLRAKRTGLALSLGADAVFIDFK